MTKVLIFDDNQDLVSVKRYLETHCDWDVVLSAAKDIPQRLSMERFDLILLDLMIAPKSWNHETCEEIDNVQFEGIDYYFTGIELLRRIRRGEYVQSEDLGTYPNVPVIAFSALASDPLKDELKDKLGVIDHFDKPFDPEELSDAIRRATTAPA